MTIKKRLFTINVIILTFFINISTTVSARVGGRTSRRSSSRSSMGSSSSFRRGTSGRTHRRIYRNSAIYGGTHSPIITTIILLLVVAIFLFILYNIFLKKSYKNLLKRKDKIREKVSLLKVNDYAWDIDSINARFEDAFFSIQDAWKERNIALAESYLSEGLYNSYTSKINTMISRHELNVMDNLRIEEFFLVDAKEESSTNKYKCVKIFVSASVNDYIVDDRTLEVKKGTTNRSSFREVWHFIYVNNNWILNKIEQVK